MVRVKGVLVDLWRILQNYYKLKKVVMAERFHCHRTQQAAGEKEAMWQKYGT